MYIYTFSTMHILKHAFLVRMEKSLAILLALHLRVIGTRIYSYILLILYSVFRR